MVIMSLDANFCIKRLHNPWSYFKATQFPNNYSFDDIRHSKGHVIRKRDASKVTWLGNATHHMSRNTKRNTFLKNSNSVCCLVPSLRHIGKVGSRTLDNLLQRHLWLYGRLKSLGFGVIFLYSLWKGGTDRYCTARLYYLLCSSRSRP